MPKRRRARFTTRILIIDGETHLITERTRTGVRTRRLRGRTELALLRALDDVQYELEAGLVGARGRPTRRWP